MENFLRGTTPTISLSLINDATTPPSAIDLSSYTVYIYLTDGVTLHTFTNDRITFNLDYSMDVTLTQQETLALHKSKLKVQIRAIRNGNAIGSEQVIANLNDILKDGVIPEVTI